MYGCATQIGQQLKGVSSRAGGFSDRPANTKVRARPFLFLREVCVERDFLLPRVFQGGRVGIQQDAREAILDLGEKDLLEYQRGRPPTNKVTGLPRS